jgi:hypothetical protein
MLPTITTASSASLLLTELVSIALLSGCASSAARTMPEAGPAALPDTGTSTPDGSQVRDGGEGRDGGHVHLVDGGPQRGDSSPGVPTDASPSRSADAWVDGQTGPVYDPPAGTFPYFPESDFLKPLGGNPTPSPNTAAYLAKIANADGGLSLGELQFAENASGIKNDYLFPIYRADNDGPSYTVHCTEPWGTCGVEGLSVHLLPTMEPEDYGNNGDRHIGLIDVASGYEYDFWGTSWPPSGAMLSIAWGGKCSLSTTGYDACASTATSTALSLGIIRVKDLLWAAKNDGVLPYALQSATKCSDGVIAPFASSDGTCSGGMPEGSRVYLAMHDADVNATSVCPLGKAILRTIDEDHFGMFVTDTNGGQDGFSIQAENDLTYTAVGLPGPWVVEFVPEAMAEGITFAPYDGDYYIQIPYPGIDFASTLKILKPSGG